MALIADILLIAGALGASFYCFMLSRRLKRLNQLDSGVGGAISALTERVSEMNETTQRVSADAKTCAEDLGEKIRRAEEACQTLEGLLSKSEPTAPGPDDLVETEAHAAPLPSQPPAAHHAPAAAARFKPRFGPHPNTSGQQ